MEGVYVNNVEYALEEFWADIIDILDLYIRKVGISVQHSIYIFPENIFPRESENKSYREVL